MSRPVVLSLLWPKNNAVALELASRYGFDIAGLAGLFSAAEIAALERCGARYLDLGGDAFPKDPDLYAQACARYEAVKEPLAAGVAPGGSGLRSRIADAMLSVVAEEIYAAMNFVNLFDRLSEGADVGVVLLNEAETVLGKTAAQWGRKRGIPVVVLSHGVNLPNAYTVTREMSNVDYLLVFGERGAEPYVDRGFPRERILVTGNPAWDSLPARMQQRAEVRRQIFEQCGFRSDAPVALLATTWDAKLSAVSDAKGYERTVRSFFAACKALQERGIFVNIVVKDRPTNRGYGESETKRLAAETGLDGYHYATGDLVTFLMASDLMIGYESSAFVEAMMAGVPAVNLWTPLTWVTGPSFERDDGIPLVRWDAPDALADVMYTLLTSEQARTELVERMRKRLPRFHVASDGASARRCAAAVAAVVPAVKP